MRKYLSGRRFIVTALCVALALIFTVAAIMYYRRSVIVDGISSKVLRLHVIANSDSDEDQSIKLAVRDAVGAYVSEALAESGNEMPDEASYQELFLGTPDEILDEASYEGILAGTSDEILDEASCEEFLVGRLDDIADAARAVLDERGVCYDVRVEISESEFPLKQYGDYVFPAGNYRALRVILGDGAGQNWWCVMYPNMCFRGSVYEVTTDEAGESLRAVLNRDEYEKVIFSGDYEIKFKFLEFINSKSVKSS